jgi:hypothetical protein
MSRIFTRVKTCLSKNYVHDVDKISALLSEKMLLIVFFVRGIRINKPYAMGGLLKKQLVKELNILQPLDAPGLPENFVWRNMIRGYH